MTQYIDKNAVVAEIERRQTEEVSYYENGSFASWADENHYFTLEAIKSFIDTLEVKKVDLEKEINEWCNKCINEYELEGWVGLAIQNIAKHFFELGLKAKQKGE